MPLFSSGIVNPIVVDVLRAQVGCRRVGQAAQVEIRVGIHDLAGVVGVATRRAMFKS